MTLDKTQAMQALKAHWDTVPESKRARKLWRALAGVIVAILTTLGVVYVKFDIVPWWVYAMGYTCAGYLISPDVMRGLLKFMVGAIRDILAAIKG